MPPKAEMVRKKKEARMMDLDTRQGHFEGEDTRDVWVGKMLSPALGTLN